VLEVDEGLVLETIADAEEGVAAASVAGRL
jgi:hypothetical protein